MLKDELRSLELTKSFPKPNQRSLSISFDVTGVTPYAIAEVVQQFVNGTLIKESDHKTVIKGSRIGIVELNLHPDCRDDFKVQSYQNKHFPLNKSETRLIVQHMLETFAVWTISFHCLSVDQIRIISDITDSLRELGAMGVRDENTFDCDLKLRIDLPDNSRQTIERYVKAYCCLHGWLKLKEMQGLEDIVEESCPSIDEESLEALLRSDESANTMKLLQDPELNDQLKSSGLEISLEPDGGTYSNSETKSERINYMIGVCDIDNPDWSVLNSFENWQKVERLANSDNLEEVCELYLLRIKRLFPGLSKPWIQEVDARLEDAA